MTNYLKRRCDDFNIIDESQAGFRKNYSTMYNIFVLMSLVHKYLCKARDRLYCIFIDFSKALDSIRHDKLWEALQRNGINGKFLEVLKPMYSKLKSCVKIGDILTQYFDCTIGTRQGCVGSLKCFSLFIND